MTGKAPPVTALALFFDDVRVEINGKAILIGQYVGELLTFPGFPPPDRLSILVTVRWPREFEPQKCAIRIESTGQPAVLNDFAVPSKPDFSGKPVSPFSGMLAQGVVHMRFAPLRAGDTIDVWFVADGHDFPAGRLQIAEMPADTFARLHAALGSPPLPGQKANVPNVLQPPSEQSPSVAPASKKRRERHRP